MDEEVAMKSLTSLQYDGTQRIDSLLVLQRCACPLRASYARRVSLDALHLMKYDVAFEKHISLQHFDDMRREEFFDVLALS